MTAMLAEKDQRIAELTEELCLLRKKIFGSSKERTGFTPTSDQINMLSELGLEPEPESELIDAEFIDVKAHRKKKPKATFDEQFEDLRVEQVFVDMRLLARRALEGKVGSVILAHSHCGYVCAPSAEDVEVTARAKRLLDQLSVRLEDHIIFSEDGYFSMAGSEKFSPLFTPEG